MTRRTPFSAFAALALIAACGDGEQAIDAAGPETFTAQVASYDLAADAPQRFLVGLLAGQGGLVVGGDVELDFRFLGTGPEPSEAEVTIEDVTASFVAVADGLEARTGPKVREGDEGVGVYEAGVDFSRAGYWEVTVSAGFDGTEQFAVAAFEVAPTSTIPTAGDLAPRTANLLPGDLEAPKTAVDSRAEPDGTVPDPRLHQLTVDQAIATGRPTLVVISTPVYCVSQFCGPITDTIDRIATEAGDAINFIHIEVWRDFEEKVLNKGAADWIYPHPEAEAREPWVFLIDGAGVVVQRWDNVANGAAIRDAIERLA